MRAHTHAHTHTREEMGRDVMCVGLNQMFVGSSWDVKMQCVNVVALIAMTMTEE